MDKRIYPAHIYDGTRIEIAKQLIEKEFRKLFPSMQADAWPEVIKDIGNWPNGGAAYHLESQPVRDFWGIVDAVMGGIKLKPLFVAQLTAENWIWERRTLKVDDITTTSVLDQLEGLPFVPAADNNISMADVRAFFDKTPDEKARQRGMNDGFSIDPEQDHYPILVDARDGKLFVGDGNRRVLRAVLYDRVEIDAWVATSDGMPPRNYWMPIDNMMDLVWAYGWQKKAGGNPDPLAYRQILLDWFSQSDVARISFMTRVYNQNMRYIDDIIDSSTAASLL